ncbi:MAG: YgcG family protein [Tenuifilaceae bacterium]
MKKIGIFIVFTFVLLNANSQTIETISKTICDSISKLEIKDKDSLIMKQLKIYETEELKYLSILINTSRKHITNQINEINYKLFRELNRNCPKFEIKHSSLLARTNVVDIEEIFNATQVDSIDNAINNIRKKTDIVVLVVTIDDLFPYKNFEEYAMNQLINWRIGALNSKGGVLVVFSKSLREIRISTNAIARNFLSDEECLNVIQNVILPEFKKRNFSKGILNCLDEILDKI